jgi:hypothetical protein
MKMGLPIFHYQPCKEIAPMNISPLIIAPLLAMITCASLLCSAAIIAAAKTSSHTTRLLAKRYPLLMSEEGFAITKPTT